MEQISTLNSIEKPQNSKFPTNKNWKLRTLSVFLILAILPWVYYIYNNTNVLKLNNILTPTIEKNTWVDDTSLEEWWQSNLPEYIFCEQNSGTIEIIKQEDWSKALSCHLSNWIICDAFSYYKWECIIDNYTLKEEAQEAYKEEKENKDLEEVKKITENKNLQENRKMDQMQYCDGFRKKDWKLYLYEKIYDSKWIDLSSFSFLTCSVAKDKNSVYITKWGDYTIESLEKVPYPIDVSSFDKNICNELWYCLIFTTNTNLYCFSSSSILKDLWWITINRKESYQKYWDYFRLLNKIFIDCREVEWADAESFSIITWKNFMWKDKNYLYFGKETLLINPNSYEFVQIGLGPVEFIMDDESIYAILYPVKKLDADPLSFGLIDSSEDQDNIFKDWKWNVFYGCTSPEDDSHIYDIVKIEWINLDKIKIIENNIGNSEGIYWILEDDKYRYTIKCYQEGKVIKTSK